MQGIFVSVSATTNGGLDITGQSLVPYAKDYFVQTIVMFLIVLGSIISRAIRIKSVFKE